MRMIILILSTLAASFAFAEDVTFQGVFNDIANAIISKDGGGGMTPSQMAGRINQLPEKKTHWWDNFDATVIEVDIVDHTIPFTIKNTWGDYNIWWDADNSSSYEHHVSGTTCSHTYVENGKYIVILDFYAAQGFFPSESRVTRLIKIKSTTTNLYDAFKSCINLNIESGIDFSNVTGFGSGFENTFVGRDKTFKFGNSAPSFNNSGVSGTLTFIGQKIDYFVNCVKLTCVIATNATECGRFQGCTSLQMFYAPNLKTIGQSERAFYQCVMLKHLTLGNVESDLSTGGLNGVGNSLTVDSDGFKSIVAMDKTVFDILSANGFPHGAPTQTKFVGNDGYIAYIDGAWTIVSE